MEVYSLSFAASPWPRAASPPTSDGPTDEHDHPPARAGNRRGHVPDHRPLAEHGSPFPAPEVGRLRGPRLIAVWTGLTVGAWVVLGGAGFGLYVALSSFLL
jgi:hypothetical protein